MMKWTKCAIRFLRISRPGDSLNFWKLRFNVIFQRHIASFELGVSAPFVRFCNDLHPLHVLKPCKNRAETVPPWLTKQKSHEIFRFHGIFWCTKQ